MTKIPPAPDPASKQEEPADVMSSPALSPHAVHVSDPETRAAVKRRLIAHGVLQAHVEDETQNVLRELFETRSQPPTRDECIALARHIAAQRAIDYLRARSRRRKHDLGPTDVADDHPSSEAGARGPDAFDLRKQMGLLKEQVDSGDISKRQMSIVTAIADGLDQAEIARQLRIPHKTVRNELSLARTTFRSAWTRIAGSAALLIFAVTAYSVLHRDEEVSAPRPSPSEEQTFRERASVLRRDALSDCDGERWVRCLRELDQARNLDPDGEHDPVVQKARTQAEAGLAAPTGERLYTPVPGR